MNVSNNISMEYEARVMVDENQYLKIRDFYLSRHPNYHQLVNKNIYLDTDDLYIVHHEMVLRIRVIDEKEKELTLKIKGEKGDKEVTTSLDDKQYQSLLKGEVSFPCNVADELINKGLDLSKIKVITTLITERIEFIYDEYLLVIDKNYYNDIIDFDIEVESSSREKALDYLKKAIEPFGVKYKEGYKSKSRRAMIK